MISEKCSGVGGVRSLALRSELVALAGPLDWRDNRKSWLAKAARRAGISVRAAKAIFYGEPGERRASTIEAIARANAGAGRHDESVDGGDSGMSAKLAALERRLATLEGRGAA